MYNNSTLDFLEISSTTTVGGGADDLRRAGYLDGERSPRQDHYWANQGTSVRARSRRWRNKSRSAR
ncbi:MAG: hypothetical protein WC972_04300 [Trueperaceae bacterium]|jgi:hypothetical protein|nr:hypothetical protein [Truepera sp.]HRN17697.1 hypothetical protein [Trueperaceae bacterium]HRQ10863.1 hypothetical protein [Trueperaceae bacterium]